MPAPGQRLSAHQSLAQKQVITQKLIQSIKLMAMPLTELRETIQKELEKNPALELVRDAGVTDIPAAADAARAAEATIDADPFGNSSDPGYQRSSGGDPDSKQRFLEGAVSREISLHDYLLEQLRLMPVSENLVELSERIIWNLDENGFHGEDPALLMREDSDAVLEEALNLVQSLDPVGCATTDWRESLLVQARVRADAPEGFERFIRRTRDRRMSGCFWISPGTTGKILKTISHCSHPFPDAAIRIHRRNTLFPIWWSVRWKGSRYSFSTTR